MITGRNWRDWRVTCLKKKCEKRWKECMKVEKKRIMVRRRVEEMNIHGKVKKKESEGEGETDDRIKEKARVYHEHYIQYVHIRRYIVAV